MKDRRCPHRGEGREAGAGIRGPHQVQIALAGLVSDRELEPGGCQPRRCLHHGHVDRVRALRTAKDQNPCRVMRPVGAIIRLLVLRRKELRSHGVAGHKSRAGEVRQRVFEVHGRGSHDARQQAIGDAGQRVLLEQHGRIASHRGQRQHRSRGEAADAHHDIGPASGDHAPGIGGRRRQQQEATQPFGAALAFQSGHPNHVQVEALARHDPRLDPARGADKRHLGRRVAALQLARQRNSRVQVPARPSARDQDTHRSRRSRLHVLVLRNIEQHAHRQQVQQH